MRVPSSEPAKRLATLFRRRLTTEWAEKEVKRFRKLVKAGCFEPLADLDLLERYYAFERKKGDNGCHRRDLFTFLNNYQGELDRANAWRELHPIKPTPRKIIPGQFGRSELYVAPTDPEEIALLARFEAERLARKGRQGS